VRFPNRYFINKEAWSRFLGTWHALIGSQTVSRRSSARYRKGREIRLNGICGVIFLKAGSRNSIRLFRCPICHPSEVEGSGHKTFEVTQRDPSTSLPSAQDD